jgi:hypothetical protein
VLPSRKSDDRSLRSRSTLSIYFMRDLERLHGAGDYGDPERVDDRSGVTKPRRNRAELGSAVAARS